jgi:broad specificity phosphatase PhoE
VTRLLLVRHGESEWNASGRWQGRSNPELSDKGREQARAAAAALEGFEGPVVSSPLQRALETAEILAAGIGAQEVRTEDDLSEIDVGEWAGLTNDEIAVRFPAEFLARQQGSLDCFPGGESQSDFRRRVRAVVEKLGGEHGGREVLVVTHGGVIGALERMLNVHPGVGVPNLSGRWFAVDAPSGGPSDGRSELSAEGQRVELSQGASSAPWGRS